MVKHKPKKNVEYTLVIPETGRIISIRLLNVTEKNRLIFLNVENNNTLDFHPSRFSFLYEKCKIRETVCVAPKENAVVPEESKTSRELEAWIDTIKNRLCSVEILISRIKEKKFIELEESFLEDAEHCRCILENALENPFRRLTALEKYNSLVKDISFFMSAVDARTVRLFRECFKETIWMQTIKI